MQESLYSLERIQNLFVRYITEKTLPTFSKLLDEKSSYSINIYPITKWMSKNFSAKEYNEKFTSIYMKNCKGDFRFGVLFLINQKNSVKISQKRIGTIDFSQELKKSALLEVGNILTGSFFNAVSDKTDYHLMSSFPDYAIERLAILAEILEIDFAETTDEAIIGEIELTGDDSDILIKMIIVLDPNDVKGLR